MGLGTIGGMGARRVASGVTGLLIGLTGDPRPDDESVGVEDMPSAIALLHTTHDNRGRRPPGQHTDPRKVQAHDVRVCSVQNADRGEAKKKKKKHKTKKTHSGRNSTTCSGGDGETVRRRRRV